MSNRDLNSYYKNSLYFQTRKEYVTKVVQQDKIGDVVIDLSNTLNTFMTDKTLFPDLDTLKEIGTRMNDFSQNFISTITSINTKVDKSYVDSSLNLNYVKKTLLDASYTQLKNYMDTSLNLNYVTKTLLDSSYTQLKNYVDGSLNTNYYIKSYVDGSLNIKADKSYVDGSLNLKAYKSYVDVSLNLKADKTYVDSSLNLKADKTYVDSSLNQNYATLTGLNLKADKSYVDTSLNNLFNDISYCSSSNPNKNLARRIDISFNNATFYFDISKNILNLNLKGTGDTSYNFFIPNVRLG